MFHRQRRECERLGVVSRTVCDDSCLSLFFFKQSEYVGCAAKLECTAPLQILRFEKNLFAHPLIDQAGLKNGGMVDGSFDTLMRSFYPL